MIVSSTRTPNFSILLAAGRGNRLRPHTDRVPKPLLLVNKRTLIDYAFSALKLADILNVYVVTNYLEDQLISHITDKYALEFSVSFCHQNTRQGTADAVQCALPYLKNQLTSPTYFLVAATDYVLPNTHIKELVQFHSASQSDISISLKKCPIDRAKESNIIVQDKHGDILRIIEKPSHVSDTHQLAANLLYIVPSEILTYIHYVALSDRAEYELPDVINLMIKRGFRAKGYVQSDLIDWEARYDELSK